MSSCNYQQKVCHQDDFHASKHTSFAYSPEHLCYTNVALPLYSLAASLQYIMNTRAVKQVVKNDVNS